MLMRSIHINGSNHCDTELSIFRQTQYVRHAAGVLVTQIELSILSTIPSEYSGGRINTGSSSRRRRNSREEH